MDSTAQPLVSVVTPVYNGAETLAQCIESVLTQTYSNWEYVVVDNCSTDRSGDIAESYAKKDSRIRVHHNEQFVAVADNHQIAFRQMAGESAYCKVVHADDWIFPQCLEQMVAVAEANPTVGIVGAYRLSESRVTFDGLPYPSTRVEGARMCRLTLLDRSVGFGGPTSMLLRSEILRRRDPFYDEVNYPWHFDLAACYEVLCDWDFGFAHQVLTYSRDKDAVRSNAAARFGSVVVERLMVLKQYGPRFLTPGELAARWQEMVREYRRFLGQRILQRPGREFWDYHRASLKKLGLPGGRLALATFAVADTLLEPARQFAKGFRRRRRQ